MNIEFTRDALEDFHYWKDNDNKKAERIKALLGNIADTPFAGMGKPEPLMFDLRGCWSRRIDRQHRLVYKVIAGKIVVLSCRKHYE